MGKDTRGRDEGRHKPLVEFVNNLEVHATGRPHVFVHEVKSSMGNELVQVAVVVLLTQTIIIVQLYNQLVNKVMTGSTLTDNYKT